MSTQINLTEMFARTMSAHCVEPQPRLHAGRFGYVRHRFPIKGGISMTEVLRRNVTRDNPLLERLRDNSKQV